MRYIGALAISMCLTLSVASAADAPPRGGKGISVMTAHMMRFSQLEESLHAAVNGRDAKALDKILSPFFEIRRAHGEIVQRDAWLKEGVKFDGELHGLSVYEVGANAVANFSLQSPGAPPQFIVDVWTQEQGEWRLRVRFQTAQAK